MPRLTPDTDDRRYLRRLLLALAAVALAYFLYRIADLLLLAFGAVLGAVLLSSVADWLDRRTPLPRGAGLAVAALLLLGVIGAIGWLFGAETGRQAGKLMRQLPGDWSALQLKLAANPLGQLLLQSGKAGSGGGRIAALLAGLSWGAGEVLVNFVIILIGALFFAANPPLYARGLTALAPPPYRPVLGDALDDMGVALRLWLLTQLFSMVAMGAMIAFGLWLAGLDSWGALGVLGGLSEFIPYVGPTLAMVPAVVVALAGGGSGAIWGVLATYAVVRLVQANIITPLISQRVVHVPPGLYIFGIIAMGYAFGGFGLFFSGALVVAAFTLVRRLYLRETLGDPVPPPGA